jgi:hypothetical protein
VACTEPTDITATTNAALPSNPVVSQPMTAVDSKASATQTVTGKGVTYKTVARKAAAVKGPETSAGSPTSPAVEAPATPAVETPASSATSTKR